MHFPRVLIKKFRIMNVECGYLHRKPHMPCGHTMLREKVRYELREYPNTNFPDIPAEFLYVCEIEIATSDTGQSRSEESQTPLACCEHQAKNGPQSRFSILISGPSPFSAKAG
jgi:hypothetical protein